MKKFNSQNAARLTIPGKVTQSAVSQVEFEFNDNIIVIEDDVPIVHLRATKWAALDQIVGQLEIKQSFMVPFAFDVPQKDRIACRNAVTTFFRKRNWDVTTGICYDKNSRPNGIRFWRIA